MFTGWAGLVFVDWRPVVVAGRVSVARRERWSSYRRFPCRDCAGERRKYARSGKGLSWRSTPSENGRSAHQRAIFVSVFQCVATVARVRFSALRRKPAPARRAYAIAARAPFEGVRDLTARTRETAGATVMGIGEGVGPVGWQVGIRPVLLLVM